MSRFHFLNVKNGDCSIIEHNSKHVSIVDICNARLAKNAKALSFAETLVLQQESADLAKLTEARKNYAQKAHPVNPIEYLANRGIRSIFRLVVTHPDMDHMDGLADIFAYATPDNFYYTKNREEKESGWSETQYRKEDWDLYKSLRDHPRATSPKCISIYSEDDGIHRMRDWNGNKPGDSFSTLSPTPELEAEAIKSGEYNDASYVFLWRSIGGKVLLAGDSHDKTWEHILADHKAAVSDVDLLIAPHHGRKSGRSYDFLDVVKPKLTFFGNAPSKDLAYSAWRSRKLPYITNNMAGSMIVECTNDEGMEVYVTNEEYARDQNEETFYSDEIDGWFVTNVSWL